MTSVVETVDSFLEKYDLKDKRLCLGFSGGYDSMCLLHIVHALGCNVTAAHLNHNWRGEESRQEEENCRKFCRNLGVDFYAETLPPDIPHSETAAREARYDFFRCTMVKYGAEAFLTAHNADDNAETVIYRIIKGTGVDGLCAIAPKRDCFYRPLLNVRRKDIEKYCSNNNLTPNNDSSNSNIKYKRNLIRHEILPLFEKINPEAVSAINSLSDLAREDCALFEAEKQYSTSDFLKLPKPIQGRIIKALLVKNNIDYNRKRIEELINFAEQNKNSKSGNKYSVGDNLWFYVNSKTFEVVSIPPKIMAEVNVNNIGIYDIGEYIFSIEECRILPENFPKDCEYTAYVNLNEINFTLRTRREGDYIYPLGANGKQKLKKYLNEKHVPFYMKDSYILLCRGQEVFWATGLGLSDKIKAEKCVTHRLKLTRKGG